MQCIYIDPPYGIKFNSNFQWSTTSRDVKDGNAGHITREPEQVKAFRDTWRDGIHSYLTYLRDRLTVARDLLTDSGSIFVQIGDENVHRVRAVMDEVFGEDNFVTQISCKKTSESTSRYLAGYRLHPVGTRRSLSRLKYRKVFVESSDSEVQMQRYVWSNAESGYRIDSQSDIKATNRISTIRLRRILAASADRLHSAKRAAAFSIPVSKSTG